MVYTKKPSGKRSTLRTHTHINYMMYIIHTHIYNYVYVYVCLYSQIDEGVNLGL